MMRVCCVLGAALVMGMVGCAKQDPASTAATTDVVITSPVPAPKVLPPGITAATQRATETVTALSPLTNRAPKISTMETGAVNRVDVATEPTAKETSPTNSPSADPGLKPPD